MAKKPVTIPESKIRNAIWYLKAGKSKKFVCEFLSINYNTKRLNNIIEDFNKSIVLEARLKKEARKKIFNQHEKEMMVKEYLDGAAQSNIAKQWYISPQRVKKILMDMNVPIRVRGKNKQAKVDHIIQDLETKFSENDKVFIAKFNCFGVVDKVYDEDYLDYLENGSQRYQETYPFKPNKNGHSGGHYEPKEGIHYEVYWVLPDGKQMKITAMKALRSKVMKVLEETGREYYSVWRSDEYSCFYSLTREQIYPVKVV